jgi:hypothetical protein
MSTRRQRLSGNADRVLDTWVRATAAQVAIHPRRDLGGIRSRVRLQQRYRGQRLPGLTIAALDDVASIPSVADRVDHWPGYVLDRDDGLADGSVGRGLAGFHISSVDQDRACGTVTDSATKLGSVLSNTSRRTHSSGVLAWRSSTSTSVPLTVNRMGFRAHALASPEASPGRW